MPLSQRADLNSELADILGSGIGELLRLAIEPQSANLPEKRLQS
jgi:hypothetical protein